MKSPADASVHNDNGDDNGDDSGDDPGDVSPDTAWGAFRSDGPWNVERGSLAWAMGLDALRQRSRSEVPRLTRPRRFPPIRRGLAVATRLSAAVLPWWWNHGRRRARDKAATSGDSTADLSRRLRIAAERLGPSFIKLGQIISSGEGLFPAELVAEFKRCRDQVPAEPFEVVRATVEADLGQPLESVFEWFEREPLAAASIAQVHAARLSTGQDVVVKVQRPEVARLVRDDLRTMAWLAPHLVGRLPVAALANPPALVELFAETIVEELDFRLEAGNMLDIAAVLRNLGQDNFVVPRPHPRYVTRRVLVMERVDGFNFDDVAGMHGAGIDTEAVVRAGMIALMEGAMIEGIFHGDLHGGNLFVLPDGRTALLDFGIVARLDQSRRLAFLRLMMGAMINDVDSQVAALRDLGALSPNADVATVVRDLGLDRPPIDPTTLSGDEIVREVQRVIKALLSHGARMPKELMLYVKNMVFLDGAIARLAPDLDILAELTNISIVFTQRHGERLGNDLGFNPSAVAVDMTGVKASFGLDAETESLTHRQLQERRKIVQERMRDR